jgi:pentatricopeptide repeat protein|tara:strand:+ start:420 stop:2846 length:2427 start_codon:yes stop_codon:yes gene_type:complete
LEAVQFAMQSFDVSDETFNAGVKVAEEEEDREDALKTNVAEFVGAVRGGSSSSSGRGGGGGRRKSKDERGSGAGNNKNAAREERQKRQRRPKSSNIANVARETKMSNREVKKSRKVRAVFMGSMDDDDDNNEREEENEDGGSFGGTRFELKEGTSEVLKTSSVSDDKTTNGEIIDVPRIEQRDNNNDKEAVLLTFLNENRMLSEDDDESSRITASNLTKCNDAIRRCTSFEEVLPLVKEMRQFGITPVESTYVAVMIACRNAGTPERAIEVYDACRTSGIEVSKRTMLLTMECAVKAKKLQPAMRVKEDIEEQGWTLSPKVFDQLLKLTIDVDMPGEDRKGRSPKARLVRACVLFEEMTSKSNVEPSPVAFNALLVGAARAKEPQLVAQTFDEMTSQGVSPSRETCEIALKALAEGGELAKSLNVFAVMRQRGLAPRKSTYTALILSCAKAKEPKCDEAFEIFYRLREEGSVEPNRAMFAALIDCAIRAGKESYAFDAFDAMKEANIPPTMATYNRLIHACGQKGTANGLRDAVRLYEYVLAQNAADLRPDAYTYGSLIAACAKVRDATKALSLLDEMLEKSDEVYPTTVVFNSCITACGQAGRWEDARKVFEKLKVEIENRGGLGSSDLYIGRETYGAMLDAALGPGGAEAAVSAVALELGKDKKGGSSSGMKTSFIDSDRVELAIELFQSEEARRVCQYDDIDEALWKNDGDYDASKYTRTETIVATLAMLKAVRYCESSSSKGNRTFADLPNEICINCGNAARRSLAVESVARAAGVKCDTEEQGSALYVTLPKSSLKSFMKVRN